MFDFTFVELILDRIDFVGIDFEIKWFMFDSSSKNDYGRKYKIFTSSKINYRGKNWF